MFRSIALILCFYFSNVFSQNDTLKVMTFNFFEGGKNGLNIIFDVIKDYEADIVLVQEINTGNDDFSTAAEAAGYNYVINDIVQNSEFEPAILSKFPIIEESIHYRTVDTKIQLNENTVITAHSAHLPCCGFHPERLYNTDQIAKEFLRDEREEYPVLIGGDFNVYSNQSDLLGKFTDLGFTRDAFDYLDYIYSHGFEIIPNSAQVIGGYDGWPSDHNAVYVEYFIPNPITAESKSFTVEQAANSTYQFSSNDFKDHFFNGELKSIKILATPEKGHLALNGNIVSSGTTIDTSSLNVLTYNGSIGQDEFEWIAYNTEDTETRTSSFTYIENNRNISNLNREKCWLDVDILEEGVDLYFGNSDYFSGISDESLLGSEFIKPPTYFSFFNAPRLSEYLSLDLDTSSTIYIAYDERYIGVPDWITSQFTKTDIIFSSNLHDFTVYKKNVDAGTFTFGLQDYLNWDYRTLIDPFVMFAVPIDPIMYYDETVDFETLELGDTKSITYRVINKTPNDENVQLSNLPSGFTFSQSSFSVTTNDTVDIEISYSANAILNIQDSFIIAFDNWASDTIPISVKTECFSFKGTAFEFNETSNWSTDEGLSANIEGEALVVEADKGEDWAAVIHAFDEPLNLKNLPTITFDVEADQDITFRVDLLDSEGILSNGNPIEVTYYTANGFSNLEFDFTDRFYQWDEAIVNSSSISEIWILPNPGQSFNGTFLIDNMIIGDGGEGIPPLSTEINDTICQGDSYNFHGSSYTESGTYFTSYSSNIGCDSFVVLHLEVIHIDTTVSLSNNVLISNETNEGVFYQWLSCENDLSVISDANSSYYVIEDNNGSYAVEVSKNGCIDTSSCGYYSGETIDCNAYNGTTYDFKDSLSGEWRHPDNWSLTIQEGSLKVELIKEANWHGIEHPLSNILNLKDHPTVSFDLESDQDMLFRIDFLDQNSVLTNGAPAEFNYEAANGKVNMTFDFTGKFYQWDEVIVDSTIIAELWILPSPGVEFNGSFTIDNIIIGNGEARNHKTIEKSIEICAGENYEGHTEAGTYHDTLVTSYGCDSIITTLLNVKSINTVINEDNNTLSTEETDADFQWLNCNDNHAIIEQETGTSFYSENEGSFALEITKNGCIDTSECIDIYLEDIEETLQHNIQINYDRNSKNISFNNLSNENYDIKLYSINGQLLTRSTCSKENSCTIDIPILKGLFLIKLESKSNTKTVKFIIE